MTDADCIMNYDKKVKMYCLSYGGYMNVVKIVRGIVSRYADAAMAKI